MNVRLLWLFAALLLFAVPSVAQAQEEASQSSAAELLREGLAAAVAGNLEAARDAFAAIRPAAPEYAWARYHLALAALRDGDAALARRYLDTADEATYPVAAADVLALRWELLRTTDPDAALRQERELAHRYPGSLPLARVRDRQRHDSFSAEPEAQPRAAEPAEELGGWTLQLGAFRDRGRAMSFRDAWRAHLPALSIVEDRTAAGATVYRLRTGRYPSREAAEAAAEQLRRRHDLTPMVTGAGRGS